METGKLDIKVSGKKCGELFFEKDTRKYIFNYTKNISPVSLTMPYKKESYISNFRLHPIFEMYLPEGYLFELLKNFLTKRFGYLDDFLLLSFLAPNIEGRVGIESEFESGEFKPFDMEEVLSDDSETMFSKLLKSFLSKDAISGVQPKTLALLKEKESLNLKEYIVKTWGEEYPNLAQNEYFSLKVLEKAGIKTAKTKLSKNRKFLLVERFDYDRDNHEYLGFEEVLVLQGKNTHQKYSGSYEQVAKLIYSVTTDKKESMKNFFKMTVLNYLLKNGDAHLKNFAVLYDKDISDIKLAPAYDVVNTLCYLKKDQPALTLFGKKIWWGRDALLEFGKKECFLSESEATAFYKECKEAIKEVIPMIKDEAKKHSDFKPIAEEMIRLWQIDDRENLKGYL